MTWEPAQEGDALSDIETPSLVLAKPAFEQNLQHLASVLHTKFPRIGLRAHAKAHKCSAIAKRQMEIGGAKGVCCQKLCEVVAMVSAGIPDVLLSNEVVDRKKLDRLAQLSISYPEARIGLCVDSQHGLRCLIATVEQHTAAKLDIWLEINVGHNRCGVTEDGQIVELVQNILDACDSHREQLNFRGLQSYNGKSQHIRKSDNRQATVQMLVNDRVDKVMQLLSREFEDRLCDAEGKVKLEVSGGGTGSFRTEARSPWFTEIQAGSYFGMDADYARNEGTSAEFEQALFLLTTIISVQPPSDRFEQGWVVVDAGLKAQSLDSGVPLVSDVPSLKGVSGTHHWSEILEYKSGGDEHGILSFTASAASNAALQKEFWSHVRPGMRVLLVPGHIDPTVNCHDHIVLVSEAAEQGRVEAVWRVDARSAGL